MFPVRADLEIKVLVREQWEQLTSDYRRDLRVPELTLCERNADKRKTVINHQLSYLWQHIKG